MNAAVITCDCGHDSTPEGLASGYARHEDGSTVCYQCAADEDYQYALAMTPTDAPLFAYVKDWPTGDSARRIVITTWPEVKLGYGFMSLDRYAVHGVGGRKLHVEAFIGGRRFWGWHYPDSGSYVRLRPYKGQPVATGADS